VLTAASAMDVWTYQTFQRTAPAEQSRRGSLVFVQRNGAAVRRWWTMWRWKPARPRSRQRELLWQDEFDVRR